MYYLGSMQVFLTSQWVQSSSLKIKNAKYSKYTSGFTLDPSNEWLLVIIYPPNGINV